PDSLCVPSQYGLLFDAPQRHRVTRLRTSHGWPSARSIGMPPLTHSAPSGVTAISWGRSGSTTSPAMVYDKAPEGQRSIIAMICARTCVSSLSCVICQTLETRLPQNPACMHKDVSFLTTICVPGYSVWRLATGAVSAVSVPSKPSTRCVPSHNGLFLERPQRHRAEPPALGMASPFFPG